MVALRCIVRSLSAKRVALPVVILFIASALAACSAPPLDTPAAPTSQAAETLTELDVCGSSTGFGSWSFVYAERTGIFEKVGLQVAYQTVRGGATAMTALLAGDADICQLSGTAVASAALVDDEPVIVAGLINRQPYSLVVSPDITQASDLRGKAVAIADFGGVHEMVLKAMLEAVDLEPEVDVTIIAAGSEADRLAALSSGQIDGAVLSLLTLGAAKRAGYTVLQDMDALSIPFQHTAVVTTRSYLASNRKTVENYLQALIEARAAMTTDRERGPAIIADELLIAGQQERADIRDIYATVVENYLEQVPYPSEEGLEILLQKGRQENANARNIDEAADIIDVTILQDLETNGFIASLYR